MTRAQILRHRHWEEDGKYSRVNACYVCGRSSGEDYYSHRDTEVCIGDALLQICGECAASTRDLRGPDALLWARSRRAMADLPADPAFSEDAVKRARRRLAEIARPARRMVVTRASWYGPFTSDLDVEAHVASCKRASDPCRIGSLVARGGLKMNRCECSKPSAPGADECVSCLRALPSEGAYYLQCPDDGSPVVITVTQGGSLVAETAEDEVMDATPTGADWCRKVTRAARTRHYRDMGSLIRFLKVHGVDESDLW